MNKQIYVEPLQMSFEVKLKDANRQKRNRSFSNASPCCQAKLKQDKLCSTCNEKVATQDCRHKIVKIGKTEHIIDSDVLDSVQDSLSAMENVKITSFLTTLPEQSDDLFDSLMYAFPVDKKESQYKELAEIIDRRYAVGTAVFRNNEYQIIMSVGTDGVIRVRKLIDYSQRYDFAPVAITSSLNNAQARQQIIDIGRKLVDKHTVSTFDFSQFRDSRTEYEDKIIEEYVLNGRKPDVQEITQQRTDDDVERLKALLEA